ncbi:hypothetical protein, partial [Streptomyces sp. NPDC058964]|uniref:hypothetical protein n=1 Tax=Streptomyces sp. NPDC058964 TaxID=3346681 RepID=UPI003684DEC5
MASPVRAGTGRPQRVGPARPSGASDAARRSAPSGDGRAAPLVRAVTALAGLPLARACGLAEAPAEDLAALTAGRDPRLRVALSGPEPAVRTLAAALHDRLDADAVRLDARPVDSHLLLHVIHDGRSPVPGVPAGPDPESPAPGLTGLLVRPGAPKASVAVVAEDDWDALGRDSVAGRNGNRLCSWPAPWRAMEVRAVVPRWATDRPQPSGLDRLLREELSAAVEQRRSLEARLTGERLARALRLVAGTTQDFTATPPYG